MEKKEKAVIKKKKRMAKGEFYSQPHIKNLPSKEKEKLYLVYCR